CLGLCFVGGLFWVVWLGFVFWCVFWGGGCCWCWGCVLRFFAGFGCGWWGLWGVFLVVGGWGVCWGLGVGGGVWLLVGGVLVLVLVELFQCVAVMGAVYQLAWVLGLYGLGEVLIEGVVLHE
ncbi:hypothetical protein, partial [Pseudomonas syringae group genomosp. 7]|uniref:hypothetical protein n=1 Tax=Pseudomonas syringae group genomosp. 7 TaxID=251699 RepID=UPI00376F89DD